MYINCLGKLIDLSVPKVMGILNVTPDSFYDGGKHQNLSDYVDHVRKMLEDGADFIDVGAYSSRPGAPDISESEELGRLLPVIKALTAEFGSIIISVDTFRSAVAKEAISAGAAIINDISAGALDLKMIPVVGQLQVPYIMMHMRGNPRTMKEMTSYRDLVEDMILYFSERISEARSHGINDLIIDPGFGFSKTSDQNFELMERLELFHHLELPILVGVSRKSMIYKSLGSSPVHALNGTTVLNTIALTKGAKILRVHDVKEAVESVKLFGLLKS